MIAARRCIGYIVETFDYERKELNSRKLKELKNIVKANSSIIPELVDVLFQCVRRENCDRRLAAVLICDQFFQRCHAFRVELTNSLQDWLVYTVETDPLHYPLPVPKEAANELKVGTLKIVKAWHDKFSSAYPKLSNAYRFLRSSKAFDFERADAQLQIERDREEEAERRKEQKGMRVVEEVSKEMSGRLEDITRCLNETRSAVVLLMPKFEDEPDDPGPSTASTSQQALHAYRNTDTISIVVPVGAPAVEVDETNQPIVTSLLDSVKMLRFYNKLVSKWLSKLTKFAGRSGAEFIKQAVDLKSQIGIELQRCDELKLPEDRRRRRRESNSDSDDFEDVPEKEGLELNFTMPDDTLAPHEIERIRQLEAGEGPSTSSTDHASEVGESDDLRRQKCVAPVLSFGLDLKYWGEKDIEPAEVPRNNSDCHRFWRPSDDSDVTANDALEAYQSRVITFIGKEERSTRQCRAPLSDGTVCPRRDKCRCPVHGPIVDRDSMGFPRVQQAEPSQQPLSMGNGDAEYMRDLERATGVDLAEDSAGPSKGRRRKGVIKKRGVSEAEKVRTRLSAKLFDRRSIKRISETLDAMQKARAARKFEHQFNYALSRT